MTLKIKELLAKMLNSPFIVEEGTSGIWTYRKWSDGTAECWGKITKSGHNINRQWGSWYVSASGTANEFYASYPSGLFVDVPTELAMLNGAFSALPLVAGTTAPSKNNTTHYVCARGTSVNNTTFTLSIHAIGKWK